MITPGYSLLLLGPPGVGKSSLARKACEAEGSGIICLAPGMDEFASYRKFKDNPSYVIQGYDDPEFFPGMKDGLKVEGFDKLMNDLKGVYKKLQEEGPKPAVLITDTFSSMSGLAMNKTYVKTGRIEPPPALSPDGAAFWGYYRNLQDSLMRICRAIRGSGLHWIATSHVDEKQLKEAGTANPEAIEKIGIVPAIAGGFRNVFAAGFDLVFFARVEKGVGKEAPPVHYLQWQPDPKRPTKSRYENLAQTGKIANDWIGLKEKINAVDAKEK